MNRIRLPISGLLCRVVRREEKGFGVPLVIYRPACLKNKPHITLKVR